MSHSPRHVAGTRPYPWPWCGRLEPSRLALLVVTAPDRPAGGPAGGRREAPDSGDPVGSAGPAGPAGLEGATGAIEASAAALRGLGVTVAEIRTRPPLARRLSKPADAAAGTTRAVSPWSPDLVVSPLGWDGFHGTPLDSRLRADGRDQLLLAGWWLETSVHSTLRSANDRGYECLLATDLVVALDPGTARGAISSVLMSGGIFGGVGRAADVVTALRQAHGDTSSTDDKEFTS
ncbi:isochorismatase family protein [Streptomyces sp. NPDC050287]|uniref:isochorismatase family protein n=1 Tax=Streptomyces sp. NPDC050287 TaxID=3365608 RepID=UPI0037957495